MRSAERIATELGLRPGQVRAALELLGAGNTIPFVARYRKEATGELDEVQLRDLRDRDEYLTELDARRATILASIEEQGKLGAALRDRIERADSKSELEDLYRPYRPKRRTRATMAQERGLGPLADLIWSGEADEAAVISSAMRFVDAGKGVETAEDALAGARDILADLRRSFDTSLLFITHNLGIVRRIRDEWKRPDILVVATGGLAPLLGPHCATVERIDPWITLQGLNLAWRAVEEHRRRPRVRRGR